MNLAIGSRSRRRVVIWAQVWVFWVGVFCRARILGRFGQIGSNFGLTRQTLTLSSWLILVIAGRYQNSYPENSNLCTHFYPAARTKFIIVFWVCPNCEIHFPFWAFPELFGLVLPSVVELKLTVFGTAPVRWIDNLTLSMGSTRNSVTLLLF